MSDLPDRMFMGFLVIVAIILFAWSYAYPHDAAHPELNHWFDSLHSGKGPCCSDADGTAITDADWESRDGHYRVRIEGSWYDVPDDAVIREPNMDGRTIVWPYRNSGWGGGGWQVRCFIVGAQG